MKNIIKRTDYYGNCYRNISRNVQMIMEIASEIYSRHVQTITEIVIEIYYQKFTNS